MSLAKLTGINVKGLSEDHQKVCERKKETEVKEDKMLGLYGMSIGNIIHDITEIEKEEMENNIDGEQITRIFCTQFWFTQSTQ